MKKTVAFAALLFAASSMVQGETIADDFNRNLDSTKDASAIGPMWTVSSTNSGENTYSMDGSVLDVSVGQRRSVLYHTGLETRNGNGASFTLSADVTIGSGNVGRFFGIVFNYNPDTRSGYAFRLRDGTDGDWQFVKIVNGQEALFSTHKTYPTTGKIYGSGIQAGETCHVTIQSSQPYVYQFTLQHGSTVLLSTELKDMESLFAGGGYAGFSFDQTKAKFKLDNFRLEVTSPIRLGSCAAMPVSFGFLR